jgi:hypothetical protein
LDTRLTELTRQLNQKDIELDQELDEAIKAHLDELDRDIEAEEIGLRDGLRQKVEQYGNGYILEIRNSI